MNFKKEALNFRSKHLVEFPAEVFGIKSLRKLNLSNNYLTKIPREIENLQYLETLNLSSNNIRNLFAKICRLNKLKILILDKNKLQNLPKQIAQLKNLKILSVAGNELEFLPKEIAELENLEELNISYNNFKEIPEEINKLKKLKRLWIAQNKFESFNYEDLISSLPQLQKLYCYSYQLDAQSENYHSDYVLCSKIKGDSLSFFNTKKKKGNSNNKQTQNDEIMNTIDQNPQFQKDKIFISYSHKDSEWLGHVQTHLKVLSIEGHNLVVWDDTKIKPGMKWKETIEKELEQAGIAILLISTSFLASEFIRNNELPPLLKAAEEKGTKILPIIISPCRFLKTEGLKDFQAVNDPNSPLIENDFSTQERTFMKLVESIEEHLAIK